MYRYYYVSGNQSGEPNLFHSLTAAKHCEALREQLSWINFQASHVQVEAFYYLFAHARLYRLIPLENYSNRYKGTKTNKL